MNPVTLPIDYKNRLYSRDDLHAAAMVMLDRREVVHRELLKMNPHLSASDVLSIAKNVEFLSCCSETLFTDLEAGK